MGTISITMKVENPKVYAGDVLWKEKFIKASLKASESLNIILQQNKQECDNIVKFYVSDLYKTILTHSPVLTGAYLSSHEINTNGINLGYENKGFSSEKEAFKNIAVRESNKIKATALANTYLSKWNSFPYNINNNGNIVIENKRPYSDKIEKGYTNKDDIGKGFGVYLMALMTVQVKGLLK